MQCPYCFEHNKENRSRHLGRDPSVTKDTTPISTTDSPIVTVCSLSHDFPTSSNEHSINDRSTSDLVTLPLKKEADQILILSTASKEISSLINFSPTTNLASHP